MPSKVSSNGSACANGVAGTTEGPETPETDSSGTGGMRKSLEGNGTTTNDPIHLQRRVGLLSGVALIVGTMIGMIIASLNPLPPPQIRIMIIYSFIFIYRVWNLCVTFRSPGTNWFRWCQLHYMAGLWCALIIG